MSQQKGLLPGDPELPGFFLPVTSPNPFAGPIAVLSVSEHVAFGGADLPVLTYIQVSCAPCALHVIPANQFPGALAAPFEHQPD